MAAENSFNHSKTKGFVRLSNGLIARWRLKTIYPAFKWSNSKMAAENDLSGFQMVSTFYGLEPVSFLERSLKPTI
jgi:hypothetical protein